MPISWQTIALASLVLALAACTPGAGSDARTSTSSDPLSVIAASRGKSFPFRQLEPGLELGAFTSPQASTHGDSIVRVLRIDPAKFSFKLLNTSTRPKKDMLTLKQWANEYGMVATTNASMYAKDYVSSVSLMRTKGHVNNPRKSKDKTFLVFDPKTPGLPAVRILDSECDDTKRLLDSYETVVQNIRMYSCKGKNVWSQQPDKKWSIAAIGTDSVGRVLFIHCRSPYTVHDFIEILKALPIDLARALYTEGGEPAELYVKSGKEEHEFFGSYMPASTEHDDNPYIIDVPNAIGIVRK